MSRRLVLPALILVGCTPFEGSRSGDAFSQSFAEEAFPGARIEGHGVHRINLDDGSPVDVPYVVQQGTAVTEGDIILGDVSELGERAAAVQWSNSRWECTVPYSFSEYLHPVAQQDFLSAVDHWEEKTGLRFVEDPNATARIHVVPGQGCSSYLGKVGFAQPLTLSSACGRGAAIHEIGHAVGLFHEQARSDRDQHVAVHLHNVPSSMRYNFETYLERNAAGLDMGPYDHGSIMHYSSYAFSNGICYPGETQGCSITHPDGSYIVENQRYTLSPGDIAAIAQMYPSCEGTSAPQPTGDDHGDHFSTATVVTGSTSIQGYLDRDDHDVFSIEVPAGSEVVAWTTGPTDTVGVLYFDQTYAGEDDTSGEGPNFALWTTADEGQLHVDVQGWTPYTSGAYTLHVDVTEPEEGGEEVVDPTPDDHGDDLATATVMPVDIGSPTTLTAEMTPDDVDAFRVDVARAGFLWVQTSTGSDLRATVLDSSGQTIAVDDPIGDDGVVIGFQAPAGSYLVLVEGRSSWTEGLYAVSATLQ